MALTKGNSQGIRDELIRGFKDWRRPCTEPTADEEFSMLTGETDDSLSEWKTVEVTVRFVQDNRVICMFDSGLKGLLFAEDFSDEGYDPEKVKEGDILTCKIKNVNKSRCAVYLTCKESEMRRRQYVPRNRDPYYHEDDVTLHSEQEKARKQKELSRKRFKSRMIFHPRFQNVTADEAMEDVVESGKDHKDMTSLLRIGKSLTIDKDTFEDLDEVMDRYVDPLVANLKTMLSYRKFRSGTKSEVDDQLRKEKADNPMRIVYSFGISQDHPGTFILSYIRSSNPHHEYIGLYPKCFRFRKRDFEDLDRLVSYFQKNIDKPPPESGPSIQTVAAKLYFLMQKIYKENMVGGLITGAKVVERVIRVGSHGQTEAVAVEEATIVVMEDAKGARVRRMTMILAAFQVSKLRIHLERKAFQVDGVPVVETAVQVTKMQVVGATIAVLEATSAPVGVAVVEVVVVVGVGILMVEAVGVRNQWLAKVQKLVLAVVEQSGEPRRDLCRHKVLEQGLPVTDLEVVGNKF
ncbi:hypothetical protein HPP92_011270 [Vanilla planifolia]|uniref:S1 motif domain-containing protein n=1 Tax=Vanilla planifolia TaxID=51239 RepID=A0A835V012_VANPL|nr:hypothetical protein HPP92_011270 [Vanilla planifolia]